MGSHGTNAGDGGPRGRHVRGPDGLRIAVTEHGDRDRPTVLLLHGYPDTQEVWSDVVRRLAPDHHVVTYDVRGSGGSQAPRPLRGGFRLKRLADDFRAVVDAVSPNEPVHLVGHDWGSVQGWEFATEPETARRITTFTSLSGPSLDHLAHWLRRRVRSPTPAHLAQLLGQGVRSWYVGCFHTPVLPELAWRGPVGRVWPGVLRRVERVPPGDYPTATLRRDAAHGVWLYRDNVIPRLRRPRPDPYVRAPVQLIHPSGDAYVSRRVFSDLDRWVPRLVRRSLPARHWAPRTHPDQIAVLVRDFVAAEPAVADRVPPRASPLPDGSLPDGS